ncbi:MAG: glycosyltransferase family 4 protein [Candidatus Omnitrophica bacterium]|nr:glycosyltransferase family 4 protein [Candidatus Omnitrophota bacterium]
MNENLRSKTLVLFLTAGMSLDAWYKGGMLTREIAMYNELARHFNKIYFISYGDENELQYRELLADNIEILFDKHGIGTLLYSFFAPFIHRGALKSADFLKTNQMVGSWTAVIAKILFNKKLIVRQGFPWLLTLKEKKESKIKILIASLIEPIAYKAADKIVVTSQHTREYVIEKYRLNPEHLVVIPNYVDTDVFKPSETIGKEKNRIIFVGRLDREKNLINLIYAVKTLDAELVLIGEGPYENILKTKVESEGIDNVSFPGVIPNEQLPLELNRSEIFVLVSIYEGNPKTLLEAMACGLPVIGTDVRGIREVINNKKNGYLCDTSVGSMKEAIMNVLENDELMDRMGRQARETIVEHYSVKSLAAKELSLLAAL